MILKCSERGGAKQLATHLLRTDENEHIKVHELRGFASSDLTGALLESYAVSRGTRCQKHLFSVSLSPPETESVSIDVFEDAVSRIEEKVGLSGQPRAMVFHEKEGRRHAHCVWSRIDCEEMKAINLPHTKLKLRDVSRSLYMDHGWQMPKGLINSKERDPTTFTLEEWQAAKRAGRNARDLKGVFQQCYAASDGRAAFEHALKERGLYLARGDRRGFVALDYHGEVYAVARMTGIKTKAVNAKLGDPASLPGVDERKAEIATLMRTAAMRLMEQVRRDEQATLSLAEKRRRSMVAEQHQERERLRRDQKERWDREQTARAERFARGLRGIWHRLTGHHTKLRRQNEIEAQDALARDRAEKQALIDRQLEHRRQLQAVIKRERDQHRQTLESLAQDAAAYKAMTPEQAPLRDTFNEKTQARKSREARMNAPALELER